MNPNPCSVAYYVYDAGVFSAIGLSITIPTSPPSTGFLETLYGFNDSGQVLATYEDSNDNNWVGYGVPELAPGSLTPPDIQPYPTFSKLTCPNGTVPQPGGINDFSVITGSCLASLSPPYSQQGFSFSDGTFTLFSASISAFFSSVSNKNGLYVGTYVGPDGFFPLSGIEFNGKNYLYLKPTGSSFAEATGVNSSNQIVGAFGYLSGDPLGFVTGPPGQPGKSLGCGCDGQMFVGEPIDVGSGNMSEHVLDYTTAGQNPLAFTRHYNSRGNALGITTLATSLGVNWRSTFDRYLQISSSSITAERADGQQLTFALKESTWTPDADIDVTLTQSGSTWTLTDRDDTEETYTAISASEALLTSVKSRNGYLQTLSYNGSNQLLAVTDSYGRSLEFTYKENLLEAVKTPDKTTLTYGFHAATGGSQLVSVAYDTSPGTSTAYQYTQSGLPFALTAIIDENGKTYESWTYDSYGRGLTSQRAGGADLTTVAYNSDGTTTVTNALGIADTYAFTTLQNIPKVTSISRASTSSTAAATEIFTYDGNGFLAGKADWNGNETGFINNSHGLPTTIYEAYGSPVARTTAITYDSTWVHLPASIATDGLASSFTYDANGELLTKTFTDTTTNSAPYPTKGQARTWTNSWSNHLLASVQTPNAGKISFGYDGTGALTSTTDALSHVTSISSHTGGGLPESVIDPNGVTTTLTYNQRQWLTGSTVSGSGGTYTTTYAHDAAGNLTQTTLPDGSYIAKSYDDAHRLIKVTDALGEYASYTLNALSDRKAANIYTSGGTLTRKDSATFDDIGRLLVDTAGAGQTTTNTYDPDGNILSVTDGLSHTTASTYDALNRLATSTDADGGVTGVTYDAHNRLLTVTDANGHTTAYVYDGFGDLIQQTSPDSGVTVFHYDLDGNLTQKVDAAGVITNHTYDALDRILTTTYPADPAENVAFTYDQSGHGFGVGRLTGMIDQMGSLSRSYDERGNLLSEIRKGGTVTAKTAYAYDAASRIASITYPSGTVVNYSRDAMGQVSTINTASATVASDITHLPFGPVNSFTFGNGIADTRSFDLDYRMTGILDKASGSSATLSLAYAYDLANNISAITDHQRPYLSQAMGYDVLNRLTSAAAADYGSFAWTYDNVGNRLSESRGAGSLLTSYGYTPGSNRLVSLSVGGTPTQSYSYTPTGNLASVSAGGVPITGTSYNNANRIQAATGYGVTLAEYGYDGFGQRLAKLVPGTTPTGALFQYASDGSLLEEADITGAAKADYIYLDGMPIGDLAPATNTLAYLHTDHLGTPQGATDSAQTPVWAATYYPFGGTSYLAGSITQNLRLPGQYFDVETQSYHNGWRDYAPAFGRYAEADPIGLGGGINSYAYATESPANFVDLNGMDALEARMAIFLLAELFQDAVFWHNYNSSLPAGGGDMSPYNGPLTSDDIPDLNADNVLGFNHAALCTWADPYGRQQTSQTAAAPFNAQVGSEESDPDQPDTSDPIEPFKLPKPTFGRRPF